MSDGTVITEEMKSMIGMETGKAVWEVDKTMLYQVAEAIEDPNPRWQEEASPGFIATAMITGAGEHLPDVLFPFKTRVAGGGDWEFYSPINPGDVVTCTTHLADIYEREGKAGKLLFLVTETTVTNQEGSLVAKCRGTGINY